jgi:hypothetical protein
MGRGQSAAKMCNDPVRCAAMHLIYVSRTSGMLCCSGHSMSPVLVFVPVARKWEPALAGAMVEAVGTLTNLAALYLHTNAEKRRIELVVCMMMCILDS